MKHAPWPEHNNAAGGLKPFPWRLKWETTMRSAFEHRVVPCLTPPACRVHVVSSNGIATPSLTDFFKNLYKKV